MPLTRAMQGTCSQSVLPTSGRPGFRRVLGTQKADMTPETGLQWLFFFLFFFVPDPAEKPTLVSRAQRQAAPRGDSWEGGPWCLPARKEMLRAVGRKPNSPALAVRHRRGTEMVLKGGGGCGAVNMRAADTAESHGSAGWGGRLLITNVTRQVQTGG